MEGTFQVERRRRSCGWQTRAHSVINLLPPPDGSVVNKPFTKSLEVDTIIFISSSEEA